MPEILVIRHVVWIDDNVNGTLVPIEHAMRAPHMANVKQTLQLLTITTAKSSLITFIGFKLFTTLKRLFLILNQKLNQSNFRVVKVNIKINQNVVP